MQGDHHEMEGGGLHARDLIDQGVDQKLKGAVVVAFEAEETPDAGAEDFAKVGRTGDDGVFEELKLVIADEGVADAVGVGEKGEGGERGGSAPVRARGAGAAPAAGVGSGLVRRLRFAIPQNRVTD